MAETKQDKLLRYLNDAYAVEVGGTASMKDIIAKAGDEKVKSAIQEHMGQTQMQAQRLTDRILALGGDKSEPKALLNEVIAKLSDITNILHDKEDQQTQDVIKAFSLENFEVGMYASLIAYAQAIGDTETATLAQGIQAEEKAAADKLLALIPALAVQAVGKAKD